MKEAQQRRLQMGKGVEPTLKSRYISLEQFNPVIMRDQESFSNKQDLVGNDSLDLSRFALQKNMPGLQQLNQGRSRNVNLMQT